MDQFKAYQDFEQPTPQISSYQQSIDSSIYDKSASNNGRQSRVSVKKVKIQEPTPLFPKKLSLKQSQNNNPLSKDSESLDSYLDVTPKNKTKMRNRSGTVKVKSRITQKLKFNANRNTVFANEYESPLLTQNRVLIGKQLSAQPKKCSHHLTTQQLIKISAQYLTKSQVPQVKSPGLRLLQHNNKKRPGLLVTGKHDCHDDNHGKEFDYKHLLTANLNLTEKINQGGSLFFDCPPMCFNQEIMRQSHDPEYWKCVTKEKPFETVVPNTPRIVSEVHSHAGKDGKAHVAIHIKEVKDPDFFKRNFSPFWGVLTKTINNNQKQYINQVKAAFEGGHRLKRRDYNIYTAFCYGRKLQYTELDDPQYKQKLLYDMKCKRLKGFIDSMEPSKDLIDNCQKVKIKSKLKRKQTSINRLGKFGNMNKLSMSTSKEIARRMSMINLNPPASKPQTQDSDIESGSPDVIVEAECSSSSTDTQQFRKIVGYEDMPNPFQVATGSVVTNSISMVDDQNTPVPEEINNSELMGSMPSFLKDSIKNDVIEEKVKKVSIKVAKARRFRPKVEEPENFLDSISQQIEQQNMALANVPLNFYGRGFSVIDSSFVPTAVHSRVLCSPKLVKDYSDIEFQKIKNNEEKVKPTSKSQRPFSSATYTKKMEDRIHSLVDLIEDDQETLFSKKTQKIHKRVQSANPRNREALIKAEVKNSFWQSLNPAKNLSAILKEKLLSEYQDESTNCAATKRQSKVSIGSESLIKPQKVREIFTSPSQNIREGLRHFGPRNQSIHNSRF